MSTRKHLHRAVDILWNNFDDEIQKTGDWFYNLKNWTINFIVEPDYESVIAYKVLDGKTLWSEFITIESRVKEWRELV